MMGNEKVIVIRRVFAGNERFTLPPKQSAQYLKMFPNAETDAQGNVVARVPAEYSISGEGIFGNIMEHPQGWSWFVTVEKKWLGCAGYSGIEKTFDDAVKAVVRAIEDYLQSRVCVRTL